MNEVQLHAENVRQAAAQITAALGGMKPKIAIILGSGLYLWLGKKRRAG